VILGKKSGKERLLIRFNRPCRAVPSFFGKRWCDPRGRDVHRGTLAACPGRPGKYMMAQVKLEGEDEFQTRKNWKGERTWPTLQSTMLAPLSQ
jgi:hypothetical protein